MFTMDMKIAGFDDELNEAMKKEIKRQEEHVELIASENYASPRVLEAQGGSLESLRRVPRGSGRSTGSPKRPKLA